MKKIAIASMCVVGLTTFGVNAADQGSGTVRFEGTVIDAPCGIDPETVDQTIDFGQISKTHLENGNYTEKDFEIRLVNCEFSALPATASITFNGMTVVSTTNELATAGVTNTGIQIGYEGGIVDFGTPLAIDAANGNNTLLYKARVKQATGMTVAVGDFSAVTNFTMTYQ